VVLFISRGRFWCSQYLDHLRDLHLLARCLANGDFQARPFVPNGCCLHPLGVPMHRDDLPDIRRPHLFSRSGTVGQGLIREFEEANKTVVATADNAASSLRSGRSISAVPHFKRSLTSQHMPVSSIAQIFIRLYALKTLVGALASFGGMLTIVRNPPYDGWNLLLAFLPNLLVITAGVVLWMVAPWLSRLLTKKGNGDLTLGGVTREDLFAAILLGLGVYFIMDSFSNVIGWTHYFAINSSDRGFRMDDNISYYDLTERVLTMVGGFALTLTCRTWARRLAAEPQSEHVVGGNGG
jgi:hypothetical protein